jgi:NIMA (never in mitosis gene a)-related kinase
MGSPGSSLSDFTLDQELGRGSFGVVYKAVSLVDGATYCMKKINVRHLSLNQQRQTLQEVDILKKMNHPNIIKHYANFMEDDCVCIVMEYAEGGDLQKLVNTTRDSRRTFSEAEVWRFGKELSQALWCLHSHNIIHRDVKSPNVLLGKHNQVKLGDLGASKVIQAAKMQATRIGTPLYLAPELVRELPYDFKVDIWGIGCVMYQLCCLEAPFKGDNLLSLGHNIVNERPRALPTIYSAKLSQLVFKLLEKRPSARPSIVQVVEMIPGAQRVRVEPAPAPQDVNELSAELTNKSATSREDLSVERPHVEPRRIEEAYDNRRGNVRIEQRRLPLHELIDATLPEIKEERRPATAGGRRWPLITTRRVKVSDLREAKEIPGSTEPSDKGAKLTGPFRPNDKSPLRAVFTPPVRAVNLKLEESKAGDVIQRPQTAISRSKVLFRDPSDLPLHMNRPTSAYHHPTRSGSMLYKPKVVRQILRATSAIMLSQSMPRPLIKKKFGVNDLNGVN